MQPLSYFSDFSLLVSSEWEASLWAMWQVSEGSTLVDEVQIIQGSTYLPG